MTNHCCCIFCFFLCYSYLQGFFLSVAAISVIPVFFLVFFFVSLFRYLPSNDSSTRLNLESIFYVFFFNYTIQVIWVLWILLCLFKYYGTYLWVGFPVCTNIYILTVHLACFFFSFCLWGCVSVLINFFQYLNMFDLVLVYGFCVFSTSLLSVKLGYSFNLDFF